MNGGVKEIRPFVVNHMWLTRNARFVLNSNIETGVLDISYLELLVVDLF